MCSSNLKEKTFCRTSNCDKIFFCFTSYDKF